jgi:hypothetical protein
LITLGTYYGVEKAFVKDPLLGPTKLIQVGETIGDCKLVEIMLMTKSIRLKPAKGAEFWIVKGAAPVK